MQVDCLEPDEAWELFKNKVGENTLRRDPIIAELARKVAEKCRGLPLALNGSMDCILFWETERDFYCASKSWIT